MSEKTLNTEEAVGERYSAAAGAREEALCCPVEYDRRYLEVLPQEILERDYGCGDPSRHLRPGETVLDLGSGGGKICYIAAQVVGEEGRVIGVDMNDEMLELARRHAAAIGDRLGFHNVSFRKGRIQDLALDLDRLEARLAEHPVRSAADLDALEAWKEEQRRRDPMIRSSSVDVIVSNCVLNLVRPADKALLFREMHRVLRRGGRAVISDIVCDEEIPTRLQEDPELWSGCLSGAYREDRFLEAFAEAGFHGMRILKRDEAPWRVVEGLEFRSLTVEAFKGKEGPCLERRQAVIYTGPWRTVTDDDGHTLVRGRRMAVCDKTFRLYSREPYGRELIPVEPDQEIPLAEAGAFECRGDALRDPWETKACGAPAPRGEDAGSCGPENGCC